MIDYGMRYPIGDFDPPVEMTTAVRDRLIDEVAQLPPRLRQAVRGLSEDQLDTPYRPDGWTVRQVIHHIPDSHLNGYIRMKLALSEDLPVIKPYNQESWLGVTNMQVPIEASLQFLSGLHQLWVGMLRNLTEQEWKRGFVHPELIGLPPSDEPWRRGFTADERGVITLEAILPTYAWHGKHHTAQITRLRDRMGWM
jgi:hypothetical protein